MSNTIVLQKNNDNSFELTILPVHVHPTAASTACQKKAEKPRKPKA